MLINLTAVDAKTAHTNKPKNTQFRKVRGFELKKLAGCVRFLVPSARDCTLLLYPLFFRAARADDGKTA